MTVTDRWRIITGDSLAVMREMAPESVDAVVCDPPYNLSDGAPKRDRHCLRGVLASPAW